MPDPLVVPGAPGVPGAETQRHGFHALTPEPSVDHRLYDAGWVATCRCGTDFSPRSGNATKAETLAALRRHIEVATAGTQVLPRDPSSPSFLPTMRGMPPVPNAATSGCYRHGC